DKYLNDPVEVRVKSKTTTSANIRQRYMQVMHSHKLEAMTRVLEVEDYDGVIAFVRTKKETEEVADKLKARGYQAAAINGDIPQNQRERTVEALRDGRIDILVATDVAARGLDVERISLVVNFDIPHDTESYVHRIGRTGRAGREGEAILFMTPREKYMLRQIEKATRQQVEQMHMPTVDDVNSNRKQKFAQQITDTIETEDLTFFRELIDAYALEHDIEGEEIAAALAVIAQQGRPFLAEEMPEPKSKKRDRDFDRDDKPRGGRRHSEEGMVDYKLNVGRSSRVSPAAIVGALTNEGGLKGNQVGAIDIRQHFTIVSLPEAELPGDFFDRLRDTQVAGEFINIKKDRGPKGGGKKFDRDGDFGGKDFGGKGFKKKFDRDDRGYGKKDFGGKKKFDRDFGGKDFGGKKKGRKKF
ncbi:MAG: helicase-related protein, partial [Rothia sp. (in: high G+C Gram-positive bacteria)]|nr:helicase-related protein [Rothia sp. (in: high G+C Gram-positive bacteria)]